LNATITFSIPIEGPAATASDARSIVDDLSDSFREKLEQRLRKNNLLNSRSVTATVHFEDVPEPRQKELDFED